MKILQVINFFSPIHGGSAEVPYRLSIELSKRGHDVTIYTSDYKVSSEWVKHCQGLNIKVLLFKTWINFAGIQLTPGIIQQIKANLKGFNIIHLHNYRTFQNIAVHHYARKHNIPYIMQAHGSVGTYFQKGTLKRIFDWLWGGKILINASKSIAVTSKEIEQYLCLGVNPDNIEVIPNGIDLAEFEILPEKGMFKKKYGLKNNDNLILFLGRIHPTKGIDLLVKAFANISIKMADTKLIIAGPDGGCLSKIQKIVKDLNISEKVMFTGPLYGKKKLEAYVDANVCILPSRYEIFGITALEAFACGTPVICNKGCGIAEIINDQFGIAADNNKNSISKAVLDILTDDKKRLKYAKKGRLMVFERYDWRIICKKLEAVYLHCIDK